MHVPQLLHPLPLVPHIEIAKPFLPDMLIVGVGHKSNCVALRFLRISRANRCFTTFITTDGSHFSGSLIDR